MSTRLLVRLHILVAALWNRILTIGRRRRSDVVKRILVTHHPQMIGDLLLLTPLLAKLRECYPSAEIILTTSVATATLYEGRPFGVVAVPYVPRQHRTLRHLLRHSGFDLAVAPGDNRYGWLALALDARWIVGFAGDKPAYKNWAFDELALYPDTPGTWGELTAMLIPGPPPKPYVSSDWPAPRCKPFILPPTPYCVLHVGASTPLKLWSAERWRLLADLMKKRGMHVVWSGGPGEESLVAEIDPQQNHYSMAGQLDLAQLWKLLQNASLLVCPDTSVAHLGRLTGTPTVALFGPGSPIICGAGNYWRDSSFRAVTDAAFPCRDRQTLFGRHIHWLRRCGRTPDQCATPGACMSAIPLDSVRNAIDELLNTRSNDAQRY
ncbi:MAG: glycosyltransferase family 9 protein [Gallionella sp.]|jgi:ADP-heptose:LPS heptosyltransferase|nr:glycosyltransferase family 9 protein [Gallionella sp.]